MGWDLATSTGAMFEKKIWQSYLTIAVMAIAAFLAAVYLSNCRDWLAEAVAVGTLINTCIVTYVGVRQYKASLDQRQLEEAKHRAELFDRRFAVFQATQKVLSKVLREAACDYNDVHEFTSWTQQAYFLFDDQIYSYLLKIRAKLIEMASTTRQLKDSAIPERLQDIVQENHDLLVWLIDQLNIEKDGLFSKFRPYLRH